MNGLIMHGLIQDLRYAGRQLRNSPGFTLVAVLTRALGIGAHTAVFSVANGVLIRNLPYHDAQRLALLWSVGRDGDQRDQLSFTDIDDYRSHGLIQDPRYSVRRLRKSPGFTAVAVVTRALGIGARSGIFNGGERVAGGSR
jgi:hypothetical protein